MWSRAVIVPGRGTRGARGAPGHLDFHVVDTSMIEGCDLSERRTSHINFQTSLLAHVLMDYNQGFSDESKLAWLAGVNVTWLHWTRDMASEE